MSDCLIRESAPFAKQVLKLSKKGSYSKIVDDVENLKQSLPGVAFKPMAPQNKALFELPIPGTNQERVIWVIRFSNSNNNKGKPGGYRVFYCCMRNENNILLLTIFPRQIIGSQEYQERVQESLALLSEEDLF